MTAGQISVVVVSATSVLAVVMALSRRMQLELIVDRYVLSGLARLLPKDRERYVEEWRAELSEVSRSARLVYMLGIVLSLPKFIRTLYRSGDHHNTQVRGSSQSNEIARGQI